ncbi:MAG TPA: pentapeptide repeat-containing protein [Bacteroidales bacterium]|nr:pentapeptide repeat-containing protein [Bacteroidales bacterium]HPS15748.1 pentapeptide repeat-containing protein [Bacteroidales bacterium]
MLNTKSIGNKIAEARKKINISQAQLAERLFISAQAVGKWERGESMPDIITFNRLAEILGVDLNYFSESLQSAATETAPAEPAAEIHSAKQDKKPGWDMSRGNWTDADFSGLKNLHDKFSSSNMLRCLFIGSDLSGLLLKSNNVEGCDFSGSNLSRSHIRKSNLGNNLFRDCKLQETEFSDSNIGGCDFSGADFTGAMFKSGNLQKNTIENVIWNRSSFIGMAIDDTVFEGTIEDCCFENCAFYRVTFRDAMLINTFFKNKSLKHLKFVDCKSDRITYAFLKNGRADLTGITLVT